MQEQPPEASPAFLRQPHKHPALSQFLVCTGGSCAGKKDAYNPEKAMLDAWKKDYLWRVCHISFSDCLGPCEFGCNALLMTPAGTFWLGEMDEQSFDHFTEWVRSSQQAAELLPLPEALQVKRYERFSEAGNFPLTRQRRTP